MCLWTTTGDWPGATQELRALLCSDTAQPFESDELNQVSIKVLKNFRARNEAQEEPPAKRRRTVPEREQDTSDIENHLVMMLNGSSSESPVLHLKDLHITIQ